VNVEAYVCTEVLEYVEGGLHTLNCEIEYCTRWNIKFEMWNEALLLALMCCLIHFVPKLGPLKLHLKDSIWFEEARPWSSFGLLVLRLNCLCPKASDSDGTLLVVTP
jgi:hypothetical protein